MRHSKGKVNIRDAYVVENVISGSLILTVVKQF